MARILQIVERNKASQGLRFANYIIDLVVCYILVMMTYVLFGFAYSFLSGMSIDEVESSMGNMNSFLDRIITTISIAIFMFLIEFSSKGRSLGKLITGTKVVKTDNSELTARDYFIRNISRAVPFDGFSFLGDNGWHDSWSDTRVVKIKDFENAINLQKDMEELGKPENS